MGVICKENVGVGGYNLVIKIFYKNARPVGAKPPWEGEGVAGFWGYAPPPPPDITIKKN